jgi:hypothetical protein
MKDFEAEQAKKKSKKDAVKMQLTLQANLYPAGCAPIETDADKLKASIDIAMKPRLQKSKIVQLLCRASETVMRQLRREHTTWFAEVVRVVTEVGSFNKMLGAMDDIIGTDFTYTDDVAQLVNLLALDNVKTVENPHSERYLMELRTCIQEMDEVGMIGLLLPLKSPFIDPSVLRREYKQKFNRPLLLDLMNATSHSGMLESLMCGLVAGDDQWLWARTLYEAMKGGWTGLGTDESTLTDAIVLNRHNLKGLQESYESIAKAKANPETLHHAIKGETSGKFQWFLLAILDSD